MKLGLRNVFPVALFSMCAATLLVASCDDNSSAPGFDYQDGSLTGELAVYISDDFEGHANTRYALRSRIGDERALFFDTDPGLTAGATVKIWGTQAVDGIRVTSFKLLALPIQSTTSALIAGSRYNPKRLAFVIVDIGGGVGMWTLDRAQAELSVAPGVAVAVSDPPLRNYYIEASYGTQDLDGRAFQLSFPMTACGNTNTSGMANGLRPMVDAMGGGAFNHYLWFFGSRLTACSWSGLGEVGTPDRPSNDTWYNNSAGCVVMVQEPGHNFGMQHSSSMRCGTEKFADTPTGACTHSEYGDRFDPMGGACDHMNGWQKTYNGWLQGCNVVSVKASGTFTLVPMELPCDGVQMLQIPMPKTRTFMRSGGGGSATTEMLTHYYLELRTPRGLDTGTPISVQVRVSGALRGRAERAVHTWMLDMNPLTIQNSAAQWEGLVAGGKFDDPAGGVSFEVTEIDMNHANVTVTMDANGGGPTCLGGAAFTSPGPSIESCAAVPASPTGPVGGASGSTGGAPGTGGAGGAGGRATGGAGGRATGGAGGRATGGAGGTSGTGTGGTGTGGAGTGGVATGGTNAIATGGATGSGGAPAGTGGAGVIGTGGTPATGTGGGGNPITPPSDVTGGCACAIDGNSSSLGGGAMTLVALMFVAGARRRRRGHR